MIDSNWDGAGVTNNRKITLPDGGTITLLNLGNAALAIDDFTFVGEGGASGRLDAGDLSIGGGVDLPASDDSLHRSSYHLYYQADGGSYFLRFDDAITADLPISATAA